MTRIPGHPYVVWTTRNTPMGQLEIICQCNQCGAEWRRYCSDPKRVQSHVYRFAVIHGHGLRPVR